MNYKRCKVYHDGSHYIGIPEGSYPSRSRPRKAEPVEDEYADGLDAAKKAYFEECYVQYQDCPKWEQQEKIAADMLPFFESVEESAAYADAQFDRKKRNLICRRMRAFRRANLQPLNYFVTLTYDDQLHTEDSFQQRLKETLSRFASRKGWRYMGVWERGGKTDRLHFHGLFYIPEGTMPGTLEAITDFDTRSKRMRTTLQSTYFNEHFGRSDFEKLNPHTLRINLQYLLKYIEKSGEKIMYSRQMKQYLVSDILEDDVATPFGKEDRKLILFSNFTCIDEGKTVGRVSPEVIAKMPKTD